MTIHRLPFLILSCAIVTSIGTVPAMAWPTKVLPPPGVAGFNVAGSVVIDQDNNVIAGGSFAVGDSAHPDRRDFGAVKLSGLDGDEIWRTVIDSGLGGSGRVKVDPSGDVVIAGLVTNDDALQSWDIFAAKLAKADGHVVWTKRINGTANRYDLARDLAINTVGDVAIAGKIENATGPKQPFFVVKLAGANGAELWRKEIGSGDPKDDAASDIGSAVAFDPSGDVIAAGTIDAFPFESIFFAIKLKGGNGDEVWRQEDLSGNQAGFVAGMALDAAGNATVVGSAHDKFSYGKVANDGTFLWRHSTVDGTAKAVATDAAGDAIVVGEFTRPDPKDEFGIISDVAVVKLASATGAELWNRDIPSVGVIADASGVVIDHDNNPVVVGETATKKKGFLTDTLVLKLANANGATIYRRVVGVDAATGVAVDAANDVVVSSLGFRVDKVGPPAEGKAIALQDNALKPSKRKLSVQVKDAHFLSPGPGTSGDPTLVGATLVVANPTTHEQVTITLPAANWKGAGKPAGAKGYAYKAKDDPCKASVKNGTWQVACAGDTIGFTLDEPSQGSLAATLTIGTEVSCVVFGGTIKKDVQAIAKQTGVFQAKDAPPPDTCL